MSERLQMKEMVIQMHEKNLVLMNILRDIAENEASCHFTSDVTEEEMVRRLKDKAVRRKQILGEILHLLRQEEAVRRKPENGSGVLKVLR
ncbi:MAG: hypothetical protein KKH33_20235 [Alphaproteobacteria bacterium]|nr:hypothetical protein [Alphaproteobacteria bacterium]